MPDSAMTLFVVYRPQVNPGGANSEQVTFYWGQGGGGRLRGLYFRGPSSPLSAGFADYGGGDFGVDRFTVAAGTQYLSTFRMQDLSTLQEYIYNKYFTLASSITMQNTTIILPAGSTVRLDSSAGVALGALRLAGSATITGNGAAGGFTPATLQVGSLTVPATGGLSVPNIPLTLADGARLTVFGARGMKVTAISGAARITGHFTDEQGRIDAEGETGRFNGTDYRVSYAGGKVVLKEDDTGTVIRVQ
jgi:hypothetical protein